MTKEPITIKPHNDFWLKVVLYKKENGVQTIYSFLNDYINLWLSNDSCNYIKCDFINKGEYLLFHCINLKGGCYNFHLSLNHNKTVFYEKDILNILNIETNLEPLIIDGGNYKLIIEYKPTKEIKNEI